MDVLEIDAATHTQVDNIREVIIEHLSIAPVRNRYKVFIIDEVHQLSSHSFNALLKSIEEPPAHVIFMMATTELDKIPDTVLSRSQVYEFRTISSVEIAKKLREIVNKKGIVVGDDSLLLIARDAEGSMRDGQSKLDQVIAFSGQTITAGDVATVLGLVGRDLLLDTIQAVADEKATAAFTLAAQAVEMGYDLRAVCRELSRVVRAMLVLTVDPSRITDPEIAGEGERDRLKALAARFSREDLLRAFDLLTRAEAEVRVAAQPRYNLEMALLRWIHLRKLVSIEDLIAGVESKPGQTPNASGGSGASRSAPAPAPAAALRPTPGSTRTPLERSRVKPAAEPVPGPAPSPAAPTVGRAVPATDSQLKDALLAEIRRSKAVLYNMVIAQAQTIDVSGDRVTFSFSPAHSALREKFEQQRASLESIAQQIAGRKIAVSSAQASAAAAPPAGAPDEAGRKSEEAGAAAKKTALREQAMADAGVQALLEVFPAEIRDVEEI
jgi:DNA polymerase-3 subunit gamma/tau